MTQARDNLVWIDLEMTGLDTDRDRIIEIATVITTGQLVELATGPVLAIHQPDSVLANMDDWNTRQHTESGLIERVRTSSCTVQQAEQMTLEFISRYVPPNTSPMCGNSICQDRRFMHRLMPALERYFHYRNLDVSSIKELYRRWVPDGVAFDKEPLHLALEDVRDSIRELQFYRERFFHIPTE